MTPEMRKELGRLKRLVEKHRMYIKRLLEEAEEYTNGTECVFCSGMEGYDPEREPLKHARLCQAQKARKLVGDADSY